MTQPLWVDVSEAVYPRLHETLTADVAIVGGGLSGIGAAFALRDSGADVVLLEERTLASGASGRNAGFVLAGPAMTYSLACHQLGGDAASDVWRLTVENNRQMAQLVDEYGIDCGFLRRGSMSLCCSDEELSLLVETVQCLSGAGIDACQVAQEDLPQPFDRLYSGGIYYPGNGEIDPAAFVRGLAAGLGGTVRFFEGTVVQGIRAGPRHVLTTPQGEVHANAVILATNAYTSRLLPRVCIAPTRGQVLATAPMQRVIVPFPMYANFGYQYWRQTTEGRLVVGGWRDLDLPSETGTEERLHPAIQSTLDAFCRTLAGPHATVEYRWAGIMGFTPDALPLVGPVPGCDGLYLAAGYSGHGVSMAFTCGGRVGLQAIGKQTDVPAALHPGRFPGIGQLHSQPSSSATSSV